MSVGAPSRAEASSRPVPPPQAVPADPLAPKAGVNPRPERSDRPWRARRPAYPPPSSHQLVDPARWPQEPATPAAVDPARFRDAVAYLCRRAPEAVPSDEILAAASDAAVDPFLLAALVSERSRCEPRRRQRGGLGLLMLHPGLYQSRKAPAAPGSAQDWRPANLLTAAGNLRLGAQLLRMWEDQHSELDLAFGGVAHRSAVSHFFWGDVVTSSGNEDLALTARRRLIHRYEGIAPLAAPTEIGMTVVPPLEAAPRVATSGPGDDRDGGARRHRGLDVVAAVGEPIRAIADGTVIFAGVNLPSNARRGRIPPAKSARYANQNLGAGGIYLCLRHNQPAPGKSGVVSCYMHLARYVVAHGQTVKAGETIGIVGRSGVKRSPPHLHFEVRVDGAYKDPWQYFTDAIIPPRDTLTYQAKARAKRAKVRAARTLTAARTPKS